MSAPDQPEPKHWGDLGSDPGRRFNDDSGSADSAQDGAEVADDVGRWPEDLDISFYAETSMTLPGQGDPGGGCGEWFPMEFCDSCGEPYLGKSQCELRRCPDCWMAWNRRRSESATVRLAAARHAADDGLDKRLVHVAVSPAEGKIQSLTDVKQGYRNAYEIAEQQGIRGGMAIFHGFRVTADAQRLFRELKAANMVTGGIWRWVREHDRDWRDLTYWSPHWHILGLSQDVKDNRPESDEQDGWSVERIRTFSEFRLSDIECYEDMVNAAMYVNSHATFEAESNVDCIRWFGDLATTKFSPEEEVSAGAYSAIQRKAAEAAAPPDESPSEEGEAENLADELLDDNPCEKMGCDGRKRSIWRATEWLYDPNWVEEIGRDQERKLQTAFEWAIGDVVPPPGMKSPRTRGQAEEALQALL